MSDVKLFRVTEFAQSTFASPLAHRNSIHPVWVMLIIAVWLATAGHWPLWQLFVQSEGHVSAPLAAYFALQWAAASLVLMAVTCWRWSLKPAITLLLIWAALGACQMAMLADTGQALGITPGALLAKLLKPDSWRLALNWKCVASLLQVAVVPAVLLWMGNVRRLPFLHNLVINAVLLAASFAVLVWTRGQIGHAMPSVIDPLAFF